MEDPYSKNLRELTLSQIQPTEGTLMSKTKSKTMSKTRSKTKSKGTRAQRKPQTMALAVAEPRLRGSRNPRNTPLKAAEGRTPGASAQPPQIFEMMLSWSPWAIILRQQALLVQAFSSMIKAQQEFAQNWTLPARQAPRPAARS